MSFSLYLGPYQPFLEEQLFQAFQAYRAKNPFDKVTVLVPNFLLVGHLRKVLSERGQNLFNLEVHTLRHYMEGLTEEKAVTENFRPLPDVLVPLILKEVAQPLLAQSQVFGSVSQTPGFYHALRATLSELKEGFYTPQSLKAHSTRLAKAKSGSLSLKLKEFSAIYSAYEKWKKKKGWLDREDTYFKVLEKSSEDQGSVWVYGFYDASAIQKKVLLHFSAAGNSNWFIPYEDYPAFEYAKPFVDWAKSFGSVKSEARWNVSGQSPRLRLQRDLFQDLVDEGKPDEVSFDESDCKILLCPGEPREAKEVARALLQEAERRDTPLSDCAVVLRETATYRKLIQPAFKSQGVPLSRALPAPLLESMDAKTLLLLLDCFLNDFQRDGLIDFLSCPNLNPEGLGLGLEEWNPSYWDVISREARIVEGEKEWTNRLIAWRRLKEKGNAEEDESSPMAEALQSSLSFEKVLVRLFNARAQFQKGKDWGEKATLLKEDMRKWIKDSPSRQEVDGVLESFVLLSQAFKLSLTPEDFRNLLASLLEEKQSPAQRLEEGGAQVVDLMQARGVSFDVMVLPGLVEKLVPRLVRQDPLLLDEERRLLNGWGEEIALKQFGALEERLLFVLAVRSAQKAIILTAPHLNASSGSPRTPSIYLFESAEAVLGKRVSRLGEAVQLVRSIPVTDWVKKDLADCGDALETLLTAMDQARKGNPVPALALVKELPFYFEGRDLVKSRQAYSVFTSYDGLVTCGEAQSTLQKKHSLQNSLISASRLETYAACPLRYFYRYVLHLNIYPDPEKVLQLQASDRGNLIHDILEKTLQRGVEEGWAARKDIGQGLQVLNEETERIFKKFEKEGVSGAPGLWHWEKQQMTGDLTRVVKEVLTDPDWTPFAFEVDFGEKRPVGLKLPNGMNLKLQGRMDRVDLSSVGDELRVVDYKTGSKAETKNDSVKSGTKLQLPFYLWALRNLYPQKISQQALYDFMTRRGQYKKVEFNLTTAGRVEPILEQVLTTVAEGVEKGLFPSVGTACDHCDYKKLCGTGMKDRGKDKKTDPQVKAYYDLETLP